MKVDMHIHSEYSQDSTCPVAQIETTAREMGMDIVCITDHCDLRPGDDRDAVLTRQKQRVAAIRSQAKAPGTLVGIELGGGFLLPELAAQVIAAESYDVVIGSVHGILYRGQRQSTSHFDFGSVDEAGMLEYLDGYLDSTLYIAEHLDVDVLAHLTYVFRYISGKYGWNVDWHIRQEKLTRILGAVIHRGIALEINTSCRGSSYDQWLPEREIVELYLSMGGQHIMLGSDAHDSSRIGRCFEEVKDFLRKKGLHQLVYFENRQLRQYEI